MIRITLILLILISVYQCGAQHIQYRDKKKPVAAKPASGQTEKIPVPETEVKLIPADTTEKVPVVVKTVPPEEKVPPVAKEIIPADTIEAEEPVLAEVKDTTNAAIKSKAAFIMNPRPKKPYVEEQNVCNLISRPEIAPQLPVVINNVKPNMVALLKARYKGRLYSITCLNMIDERLKFKLKICDKDNAKFRTEYLDANAIVVNDPDLDYD